MNNKRRSSIKESIKFIEYAQIRIQMALREEQDCLDNMPESLESSYRYEKMEDAVDELTNADDYISDVLRSLNEAIC